MSADPNETRMQTLDVESTSEEQTARRNPAWFKKGEPGPNLKHGKRSELAKTGQLIEADSKLVAQRDAYASGDRDALKRSIANSLAATDYLLGKLGPQIVLDGPVTTKGRLRSSVSMFVRLSEHKLRLAQSLLSLEPSAPRPASPTFEHLTDDEMSAITAILDNAKARAAAPVESAPEPEPPTEHFRIELPPEEPV